VRAAAALKNQMNYFSSRRAALKAFACTRGIGYRFRSNGPSPCFGVQAKPAGYGQKATLSEKPDNGH
jgi:hypothetical protein